MKYRKNIKTINNTNIVLR